MGNILAYQRGDVLEAVRTDIERGVFRGHRYLVDKLFSESYGIRGIESRGGNPGQWFAEEGRVVVEDNELYRKIAHVDLGEKQITPGHDEDLLQVWSVLAQYVAVRS